MKFCAASEAGDTLAPVCTMVGTNVITSVPNGTVRAMVFAVSFITPTTSGTSVAKSKAVIALASSSATVTVTVHVAVKPPSTVVTVISAVPAVSGVTTPASTVATAGALEAQVTLWLVASSGSTVSTNVPVAPSAVKAKVS
ncbi:hypothetical protein ES705_48292 [subsurface metagenome]